MRPPKKPTRMRLTTRVTLQTLRSYNAYVPYTRDGDWHVAPEQTINATVNLQSVSTYYLPIAPRFPNLKQTFKEIITTM